MNDILTYKTAGEYRNYTSCRFCLSNDVFEVIDLGYVPLAGGFLKNKTDFKSEKYYPLNLSFCKNCFLLQTTNVIDADTLFKKYFYFSSKIKTLVNHFENAASEIKKREMNPKQKFVLEIGCNDGSFIKAVKKQGFNVLGVDPATNVVKPLIKLGMPIINSYFTEKLASKIVNEYGQADYVFSANTLAHIEKMHDVAKGIKKILKKNGILIFEVHYLGSLIKNLQYDMIYHEHQYYYSLLTLVKFFARHGLEIYDVSKIPIHGGSIQIFVQHKKTGKYKRSDVLNQILKEEKIDKLDKMQTFVRFNDKIKRTKKELLNLLKKQKAKGATIVGYGASGRGTIIMNYCGIDKNIIDSVLDDGPAKQGTYIPGVHIKVISSNKLNKKPTPNYVLLFAWTFWDEIKKRQQKFLKKGGKFIIPLPKIKII